MLTKNHEAFAKKADKYLEDTYWRDDEEYLVNKYFTKPGARLLVLGCGAGRTLPFLHDKGYSITAIDIVPEMVEATRVRMAGLPIEIEEMDAARLKYPDNSFDYVFFPFHGIDNIQPEVEDCFREVARVLKGDGVFIYNSHHRWFWKKLGSVFLKYAYYGEYKQYRSTLFDVFKLKKYFKEASFKYRITMQKVEGSNWKDRVYKAFPFVSSSIYLIAQSPKKNQDD